MRRFQNLTVAMAATCSIHASAATITVQESAMFDISGSYANGFDFAGEVTLEQNEYQVDVSGYLEGPGLQIPSSGNFTAASALNDMLLKRSTEENGDFITFTRNDDYFSVIVLGAPYEFEYSVSVVGYETPGCNLGVPGCGGGDTFERLFARSTITFFDSTAQEVPLGATLPMLFMGLVGLALRVNRPTPSLQRSGV